MRKFPKGTWTDKELAYAREHGGKLWQSPDRKYVRCYFADGSYYNFLTGRMCGVKKSAKKVVYDKYGNEFADAETRREYYEDCVGGKDFALYSR